MRGFVFTRGSSDFVMKAKSFLVLCITVFVLNFCVSSTGFSEISQTDSSGFVVLTDVVPDAIMEVRYYTLYNFIGDRVRGYEEPVALVTRETANALQEVNKELLPMGYTIKVFDAYRPQMAVDHFVEWARDLNDVRMQSYFYPEERKANLFVHGYIASRSGHSRGSTVDLTLYDLRNQCDVDMGGTFDYLVTVLIRIFQILQSNKSKTGNYCVQLCLNMVFAVLIRNGGILR